MRFGRRRLDRDRPRRGARRRGRRRRRTSPSGPRAGAPRPALARSLGVDAELVQEPRIAERHRPAVRPCRVTPLPVMELKVRGQPTSSSPAPARRRRWRRPADARCRARGSAARRKQPGLVELPVGRSTDTSRGLPSVSVPVLSTTSVSTFSRTSSASAFLMSTPAVAPRPVPTMIDIGVASPSAHGQAMISTATALTRA